MIDWDALKAPFPPDRVHWRVGSTFEKNGATGGKALAYVDARDVAERLDDVIGPENWQDRYKETPKGRIICRIGVDITATRNEDPSWPAPTSEWIWKSDGAGDTAYEGEKGAISDAFKRAAVKFGIGRYLYDLSTVWVDNLQKRGKGWVLPMEFDGRKYLPQKRWEMPEKMARDFATLIDDATVERDLEGNLESHEGVYEFAKAWIAMDQEKQKAFAPWMSKLWPGKVSVMKAHMHDLVKAYRELEGEK